MADADALIDAARGAAFHAELEGRGDQAADIRRAALLDALRLITNVDTGPVEHEEYAHALELLRLLGDERTETVANVLCALIVERDLLRHLGGLAPTSEPRSDVHRVAARRGAQLELELGKQGGAHG
jgi:hypothetical protein